MTRCFLGFELSEDSRCALEQGLVPLHEALRGERGWPVRLVPPPNWHATLLFFPDLQAEERGRVWAEVERCVRAGVWRSLAFDWQGLALWPSPRRPGLMCLEAPVFPPAADWPLSTRLEEPPFAKGEVAHLRQYRPHITVMRFRRNRNARLPGPRDWEDLRSALPRWAPGEVQLERVSFFLGTTSPENPIYPRERTLPLKG